MLDNYVYLLLAAGQQPRLEALIAGWLETYTLFIQVPIAGSSDVQHDGVRSTDRGFQREVDQRLEQEIRVRGLETMELDPAAREGWLDQVEARALSLILPPQMKLL